MNLFMTILCMFKGASVLGRRFDMLISVMMMIMLFVALQRQRCIARCP